MEGTDQDHQVQLLALHRAAQQSHLIMKALSKCFLNSAEKIPSPCLAVPDIPSGHIWPSWLPQYIAKSSASMLNFTTLFSISFPLGNLKGCACVGLQPHRLYRNCKHHTKVNRRPKGKDGVGVRSRGRLLEGSRAGHHYPPLEQLLVSTGSTTQGSGCFVCLLANIGFNVITMYILI